MSNNDYDEFDETDDPVDEEPDTEDKAAPDSEGGESAAKDKDLDIADAETLSVSSKEAARRQLEEEMERFLAAGGKIRQIPPDESADPPRKPTSNYGSKPI